MNIEEQKKKDIRTVKIIYMKNIMVTYLMAGFLFLSFSVLVSFFAIENEKIRFYILGFLIFLMLLLIGLVGAILIWIKKID